MSTLKSINIIHPSGSTTNIVNDSSGNIAVGGTMAMGSSFMRNRIINGAMVIDQRNAGASVNNTAIGLYTLDRWIADASQASKFSIQQNAGSVTPPTGFSNYLGVTSLSAYSVLAGDYFVIDQKIEGYNVSDFAFGTANAKTITLSFYVRSSLTGSFGGNIANGAYNRSYPFSYTISAANTWELKSITVPGDVTGTWQTGNGIGLWLRLSLGAGSTYSGTAGAWTNGVVVQPTGSTSVVGTNGATFYITGVQLEVGSVATPFEREIYSNTLAKCQRYYTRFVTGSASTAGFLAGVLTGATTAARCTATLPVTMRTTPTFNYSAIRIYDGTAAPTVTSVVGNNSSTTNACLDLSASGGGMTTGRAGIVIENSSTAYVDFSAEL
jgi:hypothetical protein